jgi:hypothetical protein
MRGWRLGGSDGLALNLTLVDREKAHERLVRIFEISFGIMRTIRANRCGI